MLKLKEKDVEAVINVGFEGDTLNTLKVIKDLGFSMKYGSVDDTISTNVINSYSDELSGAWTFGFKDVYPDFKDNLNEELSTYYGAAITYTHIKQMVKVLDLCDSNEDCISKEMAELTEDDTIGFKIFNGHIAELEMKLKQY